MSAKVILYDLGRRDTNSCWSYNVWKTRMALNYKGLPYETAWVDHNNIAATLKSLGATPNTSGQGPEYTVPTIKTPDGSIVSDSAIIAPELESLQATPSLHLDPELQAKAVEAVGMFAKPMFAIYMPLIARNVIKEDTVATFTAATHRRLGASFEEMEENMGGEVAWKAAEPGLNAIKALLTEHKKDKGPFILGSQVSYADFVVVAAFEALKRGGGGLFERALEWDASFGEAYEASKQWLERDN